ncbi:hypothetical protein CEXT_118241 [Caerostris extrusa]|uniref:Ycf15 n=1 Tax=Caerostris extrusa TaxID=172846 RepID=A0AAV4QX27_CAEEX|nr:hypothetical protein CEXT_118241 [Caerostris extrusa]
MNDESARCSQPRGQIKECIRLGKIPFRRMGLVTLHQSEVGNLLRFSSPMGDSWKNGVTCEFLLFKKALFVPNYWDKSDYFDRNFIRISDRLCYHS